MKETETLTEFLHRIGRAIAAWHERCLSDEEREWNRQYDEAMQWRDWQTCEVLLEERETRPWYRKKAA